MWDFTGKFDRIVGTESSTGDGLEERQTRDVASDPGKMTSWRSKPFRKKTDHPLTNRYVCVYANIFDILSNIISNMRIQSSQRTGLSTSFDSQCGTWSHRC